MAAAEIVAILIGHPCQGTSLPEYLCIWVSNQDDFPNRDLSLLHAKCRKIAPNGIFPAVREKEREHYPENPHSRDLVRQ